MIRHGTNSGYANHGCRCVPCTEAHTDACRRYVSEMETRGRADPSLIPHGTHGGYRNWGCRCEACTEANAATCAAWRQRQKAAASP